MVSLSWNPTGLASNFCLQSAEITEANHLVPLLFMIYLSNAELQNIKIEKYKIIFLWLYLLYTKTSRESSKKLRIWYPG